MPLTQMFLLQNSPESSNIPEHKISSNSNMASKGSLKSGDWRVGEYLIVSVMVLYLTFFALHHIGGLTLALILFFPLLLCQMLVVHYIVEMLCGL